MCCMPKRQEKVRKVNLKIKKAGNVSSALYQWTHNEKRWYWINRNNMEIEGPPEGQRNLFNALLVGLIVGIKGSYDRARKTLKLVL